MGDIAVTSYTRPGMVGGSSGGSFEQRMRELSNLVGQGKITVRIRGDQAYMRRQHQGISLAHPRGGKPFFLRDALMNQYREFMQRVAQELFRGNTQVNFIRFGEKVADRAAHDTPKELLNLEKSFSVDVKVGGRFIYRRNAEKARMTRAQLNSRIRLYHYERLKGRFNS